MEETSADDEGVNKRHVTFAIPAEADANRVPLLLQRSYARSKSLMYDDLCSFRIILKWCALDHSSYSGKVISYLTFTFLAVLVPIIICVTVRDTSHDNEGGVENSTWFMIINKLVQLPESALAGISFLTLCRFFRQYGLRQLLFLDALQDDTRFVRFGYARALDKAFRLLSWLLLPSFIVEFAHKVVFFSTVTICTPGVPPNAVENTLAFVLALASWLYRTVLFLLVCVLFRLTCELQILRFEGFYKLMDVGHDGSRADEIFEEHLRIKKQLSVTSHRYRFFIIACMVTITISQFVALFLVLTSKSSKTFLNSGDLVVCSAVQISGFFLCLMGATRITHRAQGVVSMATKWNMAMAMTSSQEQEEETIEEDDETIKFPSPSSSESDSDVNMIKICSHECNSFRTRLSLVTYLQHNNGGITLYGYALDRGLLHTLFAFEFSLVLWILSKVVVLS
ncbi:uncharacterized protein LOC124942510 [Impatiens glandulifera]|uniref:uncharacterized protein LOC124942510 n=1 Tax=Impatiens glandulifera TaxID=253017 RepID=UPI001FB0E5F0|nr:uncharacterized protein LOC124942510 [Impatiens glandulifera]